MNKLPAHCTICKTPIDGLRPYGRDAHTCGKNCYDEYDRRRTYAIIGKPLPPNKYITQEQINDFYKTK